MTTHSQLEPTEPLPVENADGPSDVREVPRQPERQMAPDYYLG